MANQCTKFWHFSGEGRDKNTAHNSQKHAILSEKFSYFSGEVLQTSPGEKEYTLLSPLTSWSG